MLSAIIAAAFSFTATATGLEKGAPVEFLFVENGSDREYEALFTIEGKVADFCKGLEKAGIPQGFPIDRNHCRLWPVGCPLTLTPKLSDYVTSTMPKELPLGDIIFSGTGDTNQPYSVFSLYTLDASPIQFNGFYPQGDVYNCHVAAQTLKKGAKVKFTLTWDGKTRPQNVKLQILPGKSTEVLKALKAAADKGEVNAQIDFGAELTVAEAIPVAKALATIDTVQVKINGCRDGGLFYRAFLPMVKWLDRQERLVQPFELTLGNPDELVFVEEDWKVEGNDPKLTPRKIAFADVVNHPQTDTCFLFVTADTKIARLESAMKQLKGSSVKNWYVFVRE